MKVKKYYVVWQGRIPGVYDTWNECKAQVDGFEGAKYKSFESLAEAHQQFKAGYETFRQTHPIIPKTPPTLFSDEKDRPIPDSLSVDAACNMATRVMEYRGVDTQSGAELFHVGPFQNATNNMGEFLALVHGLAYLKQRHSDIPIYSDSITAIAWVRQKKHKSTVKPVPENAKLFELLTRAENWLKTNTFKNPILKWNTSSWGEIPADFGRK
ncbi:MAG: ribonuclease H family protein [Bacteroidales bacterium]|jgi:ribonuclease HI|nr:ribonuclease H family protein [Bacteroidales bacterium]